MATFDNQYVVASHRASSFSPFHSLRAIFAPVGIKQIYGAYERPPFPIIIDQPTFYDIVSNWGLADYVMSGTIYGSGIIFGYVISRPFPSLQQRLLVFHATSHSFLVLSAFLMLSIPYRRLTGFWDNGLRWRKPEDKLRKYDNTSEFEKATIWGRIRPSSD
ncbi:UNKNOWN [Stylonychia lemnae]|uniref:Uncharacterized protein n=1 Tax=Stylonychia lemnae TaxID=5949 RepID=A0A078AN60_STYLE|nr:UNKNOWN [Stylonychia lemnae]|eukprot:CDW82343.1 UNKNOWN [Stylonychia lemnae]